MILGIAPCFTRNEWTDEEVQILKENYSIATWSELLTLLPKHPRKSIEMKARELGLRRSVLSRILINLENGQGIKDFEGTLLSGEATEFDIGFIVGLIEGEGCFNLNLRKGRRHPRPRLQISNKDLNLLRKAQKILGGRIRKLRDSKYGGAVYNLVISNLLALYLILKTLLPFFISKKEQAKILLSFCKLRLNMPRFAPVHPKEIAFYNKLHELNSSKKRGRGFKRDWKQGWEEWTT